MTYLVDTDWVADFLKGKRPAIKRLTSLLHHGLTLLTHNVRHFERIPGLQLGEDIQ